MPTTPSTPSGNFHCASRVVISMKVGDFMAGEITQRHTPRNAQCSFRAMNLILFEHSETNSPLPRSDSRAAHILDVLRRKVGDTIDTGLVDGPRGKATLTAINDVSLVLTIAWETQPPPPLAPIALIVGLPRPQTVRKILHAATELGVAALHFVTTE